METLTTKTYNDLTFAVVSPDSTFELEALSQTDGVIIEYTSRYPVLQLVARIRSHEDESISLKPVFFQNFYREANQDLAHFSDGTINDSADPDAICNTTKEILERL